MDNNLEVLIHRITCQECSSDNIFLQTVEKVLNNKEFQGKLREPYARDIKLRVPKQPQIPEGIQQGQDEVSNLPEDGGDSLDK